MTPRESVEEAVMCLYLDARLWFSDRPNARIWTHTDWRLDRSAIHIGEEVGGRYLHTQMEISHRIAVDGVERLRGMFASMARDLRFDFQSELIYGVGDLFARAPRPPAYAHRVQDSRLPAEFFLR